MNHWYSKHEGQVQVEMRILKKRVHAQNDFIYPIVKDSFRINQIYYRRVFIGTCTINKWTNNWDPSNKPVLYDKMLKMEGKIVYLPI